MATARRANARLLVTAAHGMRLSGGSDVREVVGHQDAAALLIRAATVRQVSHAYLFAGPEGVGKTTLALEFARLLQCARPDLVAGEPCGDCASCRKIAHGNHLDVTLIELEEGKRSLGVDVARETVVRMANRAPSEGAWRIFILPEVERMTANTVNALLKTIEEPPEGVVLLLTSAEPENLLPTLLSRCQLVTLHALSPGEVEQALVQRWQVDGAEARELAELANGRLGWAVRAHEHPDLREQRRQHLAQIVALSGASRDERLRQAATFATDGDTARHVLDLWTLWWRDVTLAACGASHLVSAGDARVEAERQGRALGQERTRRFLSALLDARAALDQNANARLTFDVLMLDLPHLRTATPAR